MKKLLIGFIIIMLMAGVYPLNQTSSLAQESVTITFAHIFSDAQDFRSEVVLQIADEFMALHPHVTVNVQSNFPSYDELFNSALLAAEQGNAPHVLQVDESLTQLAVDSGYFVAISDVANDDQLAELGDYIPQVTDFFTVGGKFWSLPWNTSNPLLFYNKDMFRAAGLDPDSPPRTFDEFSAACEAILSAGIEGLNGCANWPMTSWFLEQWAAMQGVEMVNNENGRTQRATEILLTQQEIIDVVAWWGEMATAGNYIYSGRREDYNGEGIIFLGKSTAMHINSTAGLTLLKSFSQAQGFELGVAPLLLPHESATNGVSVGGASLFVTGGYSEAETQAAVDFAFFLTNTQNGGIWHQGTGYFPNRQTTVEALIAENWFEENPDFAIGLNQLLNSQTNPATAGMVLGPAEQARTIIEEAIQTVVGGEDAAEALTAAKGRIDPLLAEYNSLFD